MASIAATAGRIKRQGAGFIGEALVREACEAAGHVWRERTLTPLVTLRLLALQVLWGNVSCRAVRLWGDAGFTAQAYCDARMRLPVDVFGYVAAALTHEARRRVRGFGRWRGHRVLHVDGSGLSMPDTPALQRAFGQPGRVRAGCGFPVMHVLWLFDAATGLLCDFIPARWNTHDLADAAKLHAQMDAGDVLVGDRAFASFAHLALLRRRNLHGLFRGHQRQVVDFTPARTRRTRPRSHRRDHAGLSAARLIRTLGRHDQLVEYRRPATRPAWMTPQDYAQLPGAITVRELRYTAPRRGYRTKQVTLVTTLTDPRKYPKAELVELYGARWRVETNLRYLKQTMKMDVLRSKTPEGIEKELWMYLIIYNKVRLAMLDAATRQQAPPDRVSFVDALDALRRSGAAAVTRLTLVVNPARPGRHEPRVIKRRKDRYTYMTRPRDQLHQSLGITRLVA